MNLLNKEGGSILLTNYFHSSTNYLALKGGFYLMCLFFGVNVKKSPLLLASKSNWLTI